ncbi:sulfite exporter TauE/SafE family protein [Euzebyella marina]|uniref:Sulfite exporter TauE/SafE family protein n=1 Tax=Euzebyella marina TaxID=1761453 RepID=A0A3G2L7J4_9FLAO|nr:sulfite exporter TauE/SafE family protein [Euzebyella marina]AYN68239.1 sulfite exporter TauE/SafE family protein [Euzebyella marina]
MLYSAIILGLMGSLHCIGMCGPIAFMLPVDRNKGLKRLLQIAIYHVGRLLSYGLLGLLFGWLGRGLYVFGLQQKLSIATGLLMILLVLLPSKILDKYSLSKPIYRSISKIKSRLGKELKKKTPDTFLTIGFLNGLLPCGLVYMSLFASIAMGNPGQGALYMVLFGLGTVPLMTGVVYFSGLIRGERRLKVQKLIPVFVILVACLFILRGLGLGIPYVSPAPVHQIAATSTIECHN